MATPSRNGTATNDKGNKFANAGAAAGGFVGAMGGSFMPSISINVDRSTRKAVDKSVQSLLPPPDFGSPAQVRNYCNTLRAAGVMLSIEVAMAAEIMQSVLATVPDPEGRVLGSRIRAAKVSRKMRKSADALRSAAKNAAACYSAFQQEYQEEINRVRHRARKPKAPSMNWAEQ
ncbi:sporulation protein SsgA [Streptomyces longispororuber]|uniref:Sporulation protein SsgA n=1 Tax=Streptomyces longispororuber TaxID=68230 RepID=A0A918ZN63_9ACTN|nr:plasmid transfer protein TraA [Streptomyces longispororuber]GHE62076.1 sporulation protein SsgA [Streptomyces longispororuber]